MSVLKKSMLMTTVLMVGAIGVGLFRGILDDGLLHFKSESVGNSMISMKPDQPSPSRGGMVSGRRSHRTANGSAMAFSAVAEPALASTPTPTEQSAAKKTEADKEKAYEETMKVLPYEEFMIPVADGFTMYGRLYDPSQPIELDDEEEDGDEEEDDGEDVALDDEELEDIDPPIYKYPLVILMHGLNGSHMDWFAMPARLVEKGYAVLAIDLRGHGLKARYGWRNFKPIEWEQTPKDIPMMMRYLQKMCLEDFPQMDLDRVAFMGAGFGANVAINGAAKPEHNVKAMILLSPSLSYKGMEMVRPLHRYENPVLFIASQNDEGPFEDSKILFRLARGKRALELYRGLGHGTDMIRFYPELQSKMVSWLTEFLPPQSILVPPQLDDEEEDDSEEEE